MAIVNSAGNATFGVVESGGSAFVILTALIILFGAATYFTGRLYGQAGYITCGIGFVVVCATLERDEIWQNRGIPESAGI